MNTVYRVTGRYMVGSEIAAYHLVGDNGSTLIVNRDKAILMISRGLIENMRVQYNGNSVIVRGKGVNLNTLPVFDTNKDRFRGNKIQRQDKANIMSKYTIVKRIMVKTSCVGYVISDISGKELKLNRQKIIEFAIKGLITNAEAKKYTQANEQQPKVVLRGLGCDLRSLPTIIVDMNGNVVDTTKNNQKVILRATQVRKSGILYCDKNNKSKTFYSGDYIVCTVNGGLDVIKNRDAKNILSRAIDKSALCDLYLENLSNYSIEFLGQTKQKLVPSMILKWPIVSVDKMKNNT